MVACVETTLKKKKNKELKGLKVAIFGATGVVGFSAGVIAALEGADVTLVGYDGIKRVSDAAAEIKKRFKVDVHAADGSDDAKKQDIVAKTEVVLSAGRAGVRVLSKDQIAAAKKLLIAADVNAVPPPASRAWTRRRTARRSARTARSASARSPSATSSTRPNPACSRRWSRPPRPCASTFAMHSGSRARSCRNMASVLIAAASGRALAASARRAGYAPLVADFFGDQDTVAAARAHVRLDDGLARSMDADALLAALAALAAGEDPLGFVWGTGFEDRPHLLVRIAQRWRLIGNTPETVAALKDPLRFARLCRDCGVPHPETSLSLPVDPAGWLAKRRGGAGGAHIGPAAGRDGGTPDIYFQRCVDGTPISALFLADGRRALVLGFSTQWSPRQRCNSRSATAARYDRRRLPPKSRRRSPAPFNASRPQYRWSG